jgi:hypothetical protein
MYCPFCSKDHRSLLEPGGGDGCDPFANPLNLPINMKAIEAAVRKKATR